MPYDFSQAIIDEALRIARGPKRAPGRLVVAVSNGTPMTATSTPSRAVTYLRRMNEVTPPYVGSGVVP